MKKCTRCGKVKPLSKFHKRKRNPDGHQRWCKQCTKEYRKGYYNTNAEQARVEAKNWHERNKERDKSTHKAWCEAHPEQWAATRRKAGLRYRYSKYGLTLADYDEMLRTQGNGCAICGKTPEENGKRLAVDHDHETGDVRGLLCDMCNKGLGCFGDSSQRLRSAANYLER